MRKLSIIAYYIVRVVILLHTVLTLLNIFYQNMLNLSLTLLNIFSSYLDAPQLYVAWII